MSYIGNTVENQNYVPAIDYFNGDGSTTAFTLSRPVASVAAVQAVISNVPQNPGSAFTVSGSTITFTSAPPSGTNNIYVYYTSPNTQIVQPGQGTVGTTQLQSNLTLTNPTYTGTLTGGTGVVNIGSGQVYKDSSGNVGIGTSSPASYGKLAVWGSAISFAGQSVMGDFYNSAGGSTSSTLQFMDNSSGYGAGVGSVGNNLAFYSSSGGNLTEQARIDTAGLFKFNSGYGSVATAYGCRAWVNFNGQGTVAIRASGNVSSITDNGTGTYTVNLSNALPDANYCGLYTPGNGTEASYFTMLDIISSSAAKVVNYNGSARVDTLYNCVAFFR